MVKGLVIVIMVPFSKLKCNLKKFAFIVGKPLKISFFMIPIIPNAMIDMHTCICN